ncbi:LysM peptidoglycan-binding domain-containing protein [Streptomyces sp. NBC_01241]|uniref:LysM peptidoglycan-binding domain-containing protein n=1 Tax=Streptomyces sp. NBC_01241 TaxID=2903794 RepID=UPI00352C25AE|nr:LysM peptidoglycan-binding domain-containing protein [Streptomyces sp. NBC_01241]
MAHRTPAPLRFIGSLLRALIGLALLVALVVGVPYLLFKVGHQPTDLSGGLDLLMRQDDGTLFLTALTCIGWVGWVAFTFSVLVEIVAVLRRRSAPSIKGLGGLQSLASFLIGGIVLLAPTAASAATVTPAVAATALHTAGDTSLTTTPTKTSSANSATQETDWPTHTVSTPTESPWDLAEEYLGNGQRWRDIAALNPEIPELAAGDGYLPKGAVTKLPADARPVAPATSPTPTASAPQSPAVKAPAADTSPTPQAQKQETGQVADRTDDTSAPAKSDAERPASVTVQEGNSLWGIADKYGEPTDWTRIYETNKGKAQPGGGTFDNPDLIYPGQELDLPQPDAQADPPADSGTETPPVSDDQTPENKPDSKTNDKAPDRGEEEHERDAQQPAPATTVPAPFPSRTAQPSPGTPSTVAPAPSSQDTGRDQTPATAQAHNEHALAPAAVWMGAGALADALVGTLAVRRRLQQRRLRPGRRIPMPQGRAAATEQGLRAAQHPTGFDLLNTTLRSLALNLTAADRELPVIEAVVLHESRVELHLDRDTAPMKPFAAAAGRQDMWTCTASNPDLADEDALKDADAPYPALVSIGWDDKGHLVLVDLEHVGILQLAGDDDFARHVLQAIAVELASTPLPGHLEVTALADVAPGLEEAAPERVARTENLADAAADVEAHTADQRRTLASIGTDSLRAARLSDDAQGAWTPHIVLAQNLPDGADTDRLFDALTEQPHTAAAVITTGAASTDTSADAWTLTCQSPDETIVLPGSNLPIHLQGLSDEHFADAIELLTLAASDADVPAPDWVRADPDEDEDEDDEASGEDGLPAEYAAEEEALNDDEEFALAAGPVTQAPQTGDASLGTADRLTLEKEPADDADGQGERPAGLSLADVLAEEDDVAEDQPRTGPADPPMVLATPCAVPTRAVHVTIPAPTTTTTASPLPPQTEDPEAGDGLDVLLLGPINIAGTTGRIDSSRKRIGTELVAFLALNPGVDHHAIDDALWPGRIGNKDRRNQVISRTRSWLGTDTGGKPHFPRVHDTGDNRYRLGPHTACDWTRFQKHTRKGLADHTEDGDLALRRALALVRGRPFTGIDPGRYAWAEPAIEEMVSAIAHVAYELSTRRREAGDVPAALWAARRGLLAAEENETLHRQIFLAHHVAGDIDALRHAAATLTKINEQLGGGVDMDAETAELLRNLLPRPLTTR